MTYGAACYNLSCSNNGSRLGIYLQLAVHACFEGGISDGYISRDPGQYKNQGR